MDSQSNMRDLPADQNIGNNPVVVKGKLYAATQGQQDQLAEFASILGSPIPEDKRPENKGHTVPAAPVDSVADVVTIEHPEKVECDVVLKVDGQDLSDLTRVGGFAVDASAMAPTADEIRAGWTAPLDPATEERLMQIANGDLEQPPEIVGDDLDPIPGIKTVVTEGFSGFEIPDGDYLVMLLLHPERDAAGKVLEVPQICIGTTRQAWKTWVKSAVTHGITQGSVTAEDGETELKGFSVMVKPPAGGESKRLGFVFKQIAALIPFREVDELMLKREAENKARRESEAKKKKAKAKQRKQQSKSRRNNR